MRLARLALVGLILALPAVSACGKLGRLERPEPRPGEVRDIAEGKPERVLTAVLGAVRSSGPPTRATATPNLCRP